MDKDSIFQKFKKEHDRLRWAGLTATPEYAQLCHEIVENNAERIENILRCISELTNTVNTLTNQKESLPNISETAWKKLQGYQQTMKVALCHFCECVDIQSSFLLLIKNSLISQNNTEKSLIYRHILVDLARAFQKLHQIDEYIRKNDSLFAAEKQRRVCNQHKNELDKKYGIKEGSLHEARNKMAAHWDIEIDYIDFYKKSKAVTNIQIDEICLDIFNLTQSYCNCLRDAIGNYKENIINVNLTNR